jgi:hypothetical protein
MLIHPKRWELAMARARESKADRDYAEAQYQCARLRQRLASVERWAPLAIKLLALITLAVAVFTAFAAHASCPTWAPPNTSTTACAAVDACIARVIAEGDAPTDETGDAREFTLAMHRLERCAWSAETRAQGYESARRLVSPVPLCPSAALTDCPICEPCGVTVVEGLAGVGICALCGVPTMVVARAMCGGGG